MKRTWRGELIQLLPIAAMFVVGALCWSHVSDKIPVHWDLEGKVDRYGGKFEGLVLLPLVTLGLYLLLLVLPLLDPGKANYRTFAGVFNFLRLTLTLFMSAIYTVGVLVSLGYHINMTTVAGLALGFLFIILGNVMGKIRPNWFVGVRTPWTLSSKLSWTKTHRLAGWLFIFMGLLAIVWGIVQTEWMLTAMIAIDAACALSMMVYSYLVYAKDPERLSPAGTQPYSNSAD
ncbi:MAG TPA: SdpI family protein [Planctomycetaceae bacterium]|nr:SdpI family protein [Planctomycetaceae bacterium]